MAEAGMKINPTLHSFETPQALHHALAERVAEDLRQALERKGRASLMLSGGNTPKPFLEQLSHQTLAWENVTVGLVDERWVSTDLPQSNEHLVRTHLLKNAAKDATFVGMKHATATAQESVYTVTVALQSMFPFDVVVLGMGGDAHTASLFPHRPELTTLLADHGPLCGAATAPVEPHERITLSLPAIVTAAHCYLHIEGKPKWEVYAKALDGDDFHAMPIRAVIHRTPLETYYSKES
jgi:6-phosphogluconolactonase